MGSKATNGHPAPATAEKKFNCPIEVTLDVIGGRWKALILWHLRDGEHRTGALRRRIPNISEKMLIQQLRQLEAAGVVERTIYREVPPRVEYALTERGRSLGPALEAMCDWGSRQSAWREER